MEGKFTLTLIDLQMPFVDGLECVRRFRKWEREQPPADAARRRTYTVAVSANVDDEGCREECLAAGLVMRQQLYMLMTSL